MRIVMFWAMVVVASMGTDGAEPCAMCPNGEFDVNRVVDNICAALSDASSNIVIARKQPIGDAVETLPIDVIRVLGSRGQVPQVFEVLQGLDHRETIGRLIFARKADVIGPSHPETGGAVFHPVEGSEWFMILRITRVDSDNEVVIIGEAYDFFFSCFSRSAENSINTSGDALLEDLRQIQAMKDGDPSALGLKTGIGKMVAEKVLKGGSGTE